MFTHKRHIRFLALLLMLMATSALRAQSDSVGLYCPMDFNERFNKGYLMDTYRTTFEELSEQKGLDLTQPVMERVYGGDFLGDELEAVIEVAKEKGLKKVAMLVFSDNLAQFTILDPYFPDAAVSLVAELPEDITEEEFRELFRAVVRSLLEEDSSYNADGLPVNYSMI